MVKPVLCVCYQISEISQISQIYGERDTRATAVKESPRLLEATDEKDATHAKGHIFTHVLRTLSVREIHKVENQPHYTPQSTKKGWKTSTGLRMKDAGRVSSKGTFFMGLLALQFGLQPVLQKACVDTQNVDRISFIVIIELTKMFVCVAVILSGGPTVYR